MLNTHTILSRVTSSAWPVFGFQLERSMKASAVANQIRADRFPEEGRKMDTGQRHDISSHEKMQRGVYILRWIDDLSCEYHTYYDRKKKDVVDRPRPSFAQATHFMKGKVMSEEEKAGLIAAYGIWYANGLIEEEAQIELKTWNEFGENAISKVKAELEAQKSVSVEDMDGLKNADGTPKWNWPEFDEWFGGKITTLIMHHLNPNAKWSWVGKMRNANVPFRAEWFRDAITDCNMILAD